MSLSAKIDLSAEPVLGAGSGELEAMPRRPTRSHAFSGILVIVAAVFVIAVAVPLIGIQSKKTEFLANLEKRLEILARSRAEVVGAWLEGITRPADRLAGSELFRLFAAQMDLTRSDGSDSASGAPRAADGAGPTDRFEVPLAAQLPLIETVLTDFTRDARFLSGYLIDRDAVAHVTSTGSDPITPAQKALARQVFTEGTLLYGPIRIAANGLVLDIATPVLGAPDESETRHPVAVVLLTAPITARVGELLTPPPLAEPGERLRLFQQNDGSFYEIAPGSPPTLRPIVGLELTTPERTLPFAHRASIGGTHQVYSVASPTTGPSWWIAQETDATLVHEKIDRLVTSALMVAILLVVMVMATFGAFWWRLASERNTALAAQFRRLAGQVSAHRNLLDGINNTIADLIGLKAMDGTYHYVNPAFARAIGRDVDTIIGSDDTAIFGKATAERMRISDQRVLKSGAMVTVNEEVYLDKKRRHLQFSKVPYRDEYGHAAGVVSVGRDITELVEEQDKTDRTIRQMVAALVRAVELRDPYLAGHSRRLAGFATAVARQLSASAEEIATVDISANLSQIGKLAVPRKILNKEKRLTVSEIKQMEQHVDHAVSILQTIDFELPVIETVSQLHERLEGGGYPRGLSGDEICLTGRILGACDVFCARVEPRSYRPAISPEAALEILENNSDRYDLAVVEALRKVVGSATGATLLSEIASD